MLNRRKDLAAVMRHPLIRDINADRIGLTKRVTVGIQGDAKAVADMVAKIDATATSIFEMADKEDISCGTAADRIAESRFCVKKACKAA